MTDIESLVARLEAPCIGNGMILRNPDGPDAIAAIRTLQTEKVELWERIADYRDCFDEITAKAIPQCGDEGDPEKVTRYVLPVGPIHRAAGKLGHQMFNMEARFTELVAGIAEYERAMREDVIPQIDRDLREQAKAAAEIRARPLFRQALSNTGEME